MPKDLGGNGFGQLPLAQMNLITGRAGVAMEVFGNMAPDSGNAELIAEGGTEQRDMSADPETFDESRNEHRPQAATGVDIGRGSPGTRVEHQ
jgi:acyl-CoA dehydrogenase